MHPDLARRRRNQVLLAMYETGKINSTQLHDATAAPLGLKIQRWNYTIAPYFVEEVRQFLERKYGPEAVREKGLRVYTTLNIKTQEVAEEALKEGLRNDDKRRGWRGPEKNILKNPPLTSQGKPISLETYVDDDWDQPPDPGESGPRPGDGGESRLRRGALRRRNGAHYSAGFCLDEQDPSH